MRTQFPSVDRDRGGSVHVAAEFGGVSIRVSSGATMGTWFDLTPDEARKLAESLVLAADALQLEEMT